MSKMYFSEEASFGEKIWDEVMHDFFPDAKDDAEIEEELDNLWND